jgi:hypothetical protein
MNRGFSDNEVVVILILCVTVLLFGVGKCANESSKRSDAARETCIKLGRVWECQPTACVCQK